MFILQTFIHHRSPQSPPPTVLYTGTVPQGQQDFEPEAMAGETWESKTMGRTWRSGTSPGLAQGSSILLETHIPLAPPTLNCATKISSLPLASFCHHGQILSSF
jgi:hypothetical protein